MADIELKKAFNEMHINKIETTKQMKLINYKADVLMNTKQKYLLTEKGISNLDDNARVFSSIGRMFALTTIQDIRTELKTNQEKCEGAVKQLVEKKNYLVKSLQEQEDSLRELVKQKKDSDNLPK